MAKFADYEFRITGETPLLMHQDDVMLSGELDEWRKAPENKNLSRPGDDRSPAWTWQTYCYCDGESLCIPSGNIMVCLRSAGTQMILKKQKTYREVTQSGLLIADEYCRLLVGGKQIPWSKIEALRELSFTDQVSAVRELGFSLFVKRAKVGQSKHIRVRARFDEWAIEGRITCRAPEITPETMKKLFELAGAVGLCDWRPGCKTPGSYGMFSTELRAL